MFFSTFEQTDPARHLMGGVGTPAVQIIKTGVTPTITPCTLSYIVVRSKLPAYTPTPIRRDYGRNGADIGRGK